MQDRLRELEGTLARTKERKNTILYKLSKRKQEEERLERLGVQKLPTNPFEVEDVNVIKYVLFRLKQEIGDKIAHLRDSKVLSIAKDGEAIVRAKNDEVNKLLSRKALWESRMATLNGGETGSNARRKLFFGCAKELPEAESSRKRPREEGDAGADRAAAAVDSDDEDEEAMIEEAPVEAVTRDSDYLAQVQWLGSSLADKELVAGERAAEAMMREKQPTSGSHVTSSSLVLSHMKDGQLDIPDEESFKAQLLAKRKKALQERLKMLKEKK